MKLRFQLAVLIALLVICATTQSSFSQNPERPGFPQPQLQSGDRQIKAIYAAVASMHKLDIAAQADGTIQDLVADEGAIVDKDDPLLVIDDRVARAEVAVAQKELDAANKQASQTANIEYSKKASEVSDAEYEDILKLFEQRAATYSEARRKRLEAERARLGIEVAEIEHEKEVLAADVAKEKLKAAEVKLDLYSINAPISGVIAKRFRDQGEWVRAGEKVLQLVHMDEMRVNADVKVTGISIADLQGAPMRIEIPINGRQNATFEANVEYVAPVVTSNEIKVWARISNERLGERGWLLRDGMKANVTITLPGN